VGVSNHVARADAEAMSGRVDCSSQRTIWTGVLVVLLAMALSAAGVALGEVHSGAETALSAAGGRAVYLVAPHDGAILPAKCLSEAHLPVRLGQIEAPVAPDPNFSLRRPVSRAPPTTLSGFLHDSRTSTRCSPASDPVARRTRALVRSSSLFQAGILDIRALRTTKGTLPSAEDRSGMKPSRRSRSPWHPRPAVAARTLYLDDGTSQRTRGE
jgi:hypothetical protein